MDLPLPPTGPRPLPRSAPGDQGVDAAGVLAFVDALDVAPAVEPHGLMVLRHGHVVAEGWWAPYAPDRVHLLYSLSKSFTSAAVGLAVAEGLLSLDDTVLAHFPELDDEVTDPRVRRLLVRHVAAMASGHETEAIDRALAADPEDLLRGFLLTPPEREPGSVFAYNQPCTYALGAIVSRRSGLSLTDYLRPRLLEPLGITDVAWSRDAAGRDLGYSGLHATTDAVARLGLLHLAGGRWEGRPLLPAAWVAEATRAHVRNDHTGSGPDWSLGYGFQLWRSRHGYRGDGAYGQFCLVLPEQDAVVALTAATEDMQGVLDAAWAHLVPALGGGDAAGTSGGDAAGADGTAERALADRLAGLELPAVDGAPQPPVAEADVWDGFAGTAVDGPVAAATVERAGDGWRLTLVGRDPADTGHPLVARLGTGDAPGAPATPAAAGWAVSHATTPDGPLPLAVSGGWTPAGTLRADVVFLETPHRLELTMDAERGTVTARWRTEPLGHAPLVRLRAPRR